MFLFLFFAVSIDLNSQILYSTEEEFDVELNGWETFGQRNGDVTTLNMTTQDFEDYPVSYVPIGTGIFVFGLCSGLYLLNKRRKL